MKVKGGRESKNVVIDKDPYSAIVSGWLEREPEFYSEIFYGMSKEDISNEMSSVVHDYEQKMGRKHKDSNELKDILRVWMYEKIRNSRAADRWNVDENKMKNNAEDAKARLGLNKSDKENKMPYDEKEPEDNPEEENSEYNQSSEKKARAAREFMSEMKVSESKGDMEGQKIAKGSLFMARLESLAEQLAKRYKSIFSSPEDAKEEIHSRLAAGEGLNQIARTFLHGDINDLEKKMGTSPDAPDQGKQEDPGTIRDRINKLKEQMDALNKE